MNVKRIPVSLLTLFLATSLSVPAFAAKSAKEFSDWDGEAWYAEAMEWCVARGVFLGTPENTLEAQREITRAEFTAILVRYFGCQETRLIAASRTAAKQKKEKGVRFIVYSFLKLHMCNR